MTPASGARKCNVLESVFLTHNVRFAAAVSFPRQPLAHVHRAAEAARRITDGGRGVGCWLRAPDPTTLEVVASEEALPPVALLDGPTDASTATVVDRVIHTDTDDLATVSIIPSAAGQQAAAICFNFNHAVCDGHAMVRYVETFCNALIDGRPAAAAAPPTVPAADADALVVAAQRPRGEWKPAPLYPEQAGVHPLTIRDIAQQATQPEDGQCCRGADIRSCLPEALVTPAVHAAKAFAQVEGKVLPTVTGVLMACLSTALASTYFRGGHQTAVQSNAPPTSHPAVGISISVLVNMRPMLTAPEGFANAISTVTVGSVHRRADLEQCSDGTRAQALAALAQQQTAELKRRIQDGEAHMSVLARNSGDEEAIPTATVELSNQGVYGIPDGFQVGLSQRFDAYEDASVLFHSEKGTVHLVVSIGKGIHAGVVRQVLDEMTANVALLGKC